MDSEQRFIDFIYIMEEHTMDFIKTLIDQILGAIKAIGSDNSQIAKVIDALKNIFASLGKKDDAE